MPSPSKAPVLVLTLIISLLCLTIGAIALIVLFNANRPDSATIAAACKSEVGAAIKTESDKVAAACAEKPAVVATKKVAANLHHPGFSYPENIQVSGSLSFINKTSEFMHSINFFRNAPINECTDCDAGPVAAITITNNPSDIVLKTQKTLADFIAAQYPANSVYKDVVVKDATLNGQHVTIVTSSYKDDFMGQNVKLEHILAQAGTRVVEIKYYQYGDTSFDGYIEPSVWETVKNSLDFSKIQ